MGACLQELANVMLTTLGQHYSRSRQSSMLHLGRSGLSKVSNLPIRKLSNAVQAIITALSIRGGQRH